MEDITWYQEKYGKGWLREYNYDKNMEGDGDKKHVKSKKYSSNGYKSKRLWAEEDYYRQEVRELTNNNIHHILNSHKRGFKKYHIDHKISIHFGFINNIPAQQIAHPSNLQMLWWEDNIKKSAVCNVDEDNKWILLENDIPSHDTSHPTL